LATVTSRSTLASVPESTICCSRVMMFSTIAIGIVERWRRFLCPAGVMTHGSQEVIEHGPDGVPERSDPAWKVRHRAHGRRPP